MIYHRRSVLGFGAAAGLLALPGCSSLPGLSLTEAIKRLLTLSSQNAFAELLQPNGFFDSQVARISVPVILFSNTFGCESYPHRHIGCPEAGRMW